MLVATFNITVFAADEISTFGITMSGFKGWAREKAEKFVIQRHLSHSSERCDLKKIYLHS